MNTATLVDDRTMTISAGQPWFEARDVAAFILAAVMTLGPLAATALFA